MVAWRFASVRLVRFAPARSRASLANSRDCAATRRDVPRGRLPPFWSIRRPSMRQGTATTACCSGSARAASTSMSWTCCASAPLSAPLRQARRGELDCGRAPVGFVKAGNRYEKASGSTCPVKRSSWCSTRSRNFRSSARQALCWLHRVQISDLPVKQSTNGDTAWRRPSYSAIHRIIENPVYLGGAGGPMVKTAVAAGYSAEGVSVKIQPQDAWNEWLALKPNTH